MIGNNLRFDLFV